MILADDHCHLMHAAYTNVDSIIEKAKKNSLPKLIQPGDIRSIIHSHSNWSDGSNTIEEMANECIKRGL